MFRTEVEAFRRDRLAGDVVISVPMAWQTIGYLLLASIVAAIAFLSVAGYARVETVNGVIVPEAGVTAIVPSRSGVIASLPVREGQMVPAGTPLAFIRAEVDSAAGASFNDQAQAAIARQDQSLVAQSQASASASVAQQAQLSALRAGLVDEIAQMQSQIAIQKTLVAAAREDLSRALKIADRGFISGNDLERRRETVSLREQGLSQFRQSLAAKRSALEQAERSSAQLQAQARAQAADITAQRAQLAQEAANAAGSSSYVLRAPVAGKVTALTARVGQPASTGDALMTIIPANSALRAELDAPTSAIGFIKPGQEVRLAIDAFPFQRFGTIKGKVLTVATSAISRERAEGTTDLVYPVTVALERQQLMAYGHLEPLVPDMTVTARIVTEKQSLLQWLFAPLYAVRGR